MQGIMIKLRFSDEWVIFSTYQRGVGRMGYFYLKTNQLLDAIHMKTLFRDNDSYHWMLVLVYKNDANIYFTWINSTRETNLSSTSRMEGTIQHVHIPIDDLCNALHNRIDTRFLYIPEGHAPRFTFTPSAHKYIQKIAADKTLRNAFRKAMSTNFRWRDDSITFYSDGYPNFFFRANGLCGGLVASKFKQNFGTGTFPVVRFNVHT